MKHTAKSRESYYPQDEVALNETVNKLMKDWREAANDDSFNSYGFVQ